MSDATDTKGAVSGHASTQHLYARAQARVPAGTHSNARMRSPHPIFAARAEGAHLWDVDGRRWLDCTMGNGSVILGHAHPAVMAAVKRTVERGLTTGQETADAVEAVELLAEIIPDCGLVRFANTGTEAVMHALAIARDATGRSRVAKAEGAYHGWTEPVWVSTWPTLEQAGDSRQPNAVPSSNGLSGIWTNTLVLPFNDVAATVELVEKHAQELAAVVVEPMLIDIGFVPATHEYLAALREVTRQHRILLIFDELLTGFRIAPGGARQYFGVSADLTLFGKALANGYPLAAVEGEPALMNRTDPAKGGTVGWVGTYNGHASAVAAAAATLNELRDTSVHDRLVELTDKLQVGFKEITQAAHGVPAVLAGSGGHFQPYFCDHPPTDYRSAMTSDPGTYRSFVDAARHRDVLVAEKPLLHCALSAAHTEEDLRTILAAIQDALVSGTAP